MPKRTAPTRSAIALRELSARELPKLYPLIYHFNPTMTKRLFTARLKTMVPLGYGAVAAFDGKKIVGISGFWLRERFWSGRQIDVDNFFIAPDYQGSGIGAKLVEWLERKALAEKCDLMVLDVYANNNRAHRFYHRMGFVITGYHFTKVPGTDVPYIMGMRRE